MMNQRKQMIGQKKMRLQIGTAMKIIMIQIIITDIGKTEMTRVQKLITEIIKKLQETLLLLIWVL